jgi:hypothetical protein
MLALSVYAFCVQYVYDSTRSQGRQQLAYGKQGFSQVFFLFPSPPEKRGNEHVGWGLAANQSDL